jgi:hypothetical protein
LHLRSAGSVLPVTQLRWPEPAIETGERLIEKAALAEQALRQNGELLVGDAHKAVAVEPAAPAGIAAGLNLSHLIGALDAVAPAAVSEVGDRHG